MFKTSFIFPLPCFVLRMTKRCQVRTFRMFPDRSLVTDLICSSNFAREVRLFYIVFRQLRSSIIKKPQNDRARAKEWKRFGSDVIPFICSQKFREKHTTNRLAREAEHEFSIDEVEICFKFLTIQSDLTIQLFPRNSMFLMKKLSGLLRSEISEISLVGPFNFQLRD